MIFDPPTNDIFISSWERLVLYYSISVGFLQVLTFVTQQQIAEALGALNGATRRLRKTKSASEKCEERQKYKERQNQADFLRNCN